MLFWGGIFMLVLFIAIRTINYGRWVGKKGNSRGAIGLYILSLVAIFLPVFTYYLNNRR